MKTVVYVDAFNLYYGAVKGTPYKWLDLLRLGQLLLPSHDVRHIHYFTARIKDRPNDSQGPLRQQIYLRALKTIPNLTITFGTFHTHEAVMPLVNPVPGQSRYATVFKTQEKGSDVNLTSQLLWDGYRNYYDTAAIISNDSDLLRAVQIVRHNLGKAVGFLNPQPHPSRVLRNNSDFMKDIRTGVLRASQFPATLTDAKGVFHKPSAW